jgi:hypothetical protein
MIENIYGSRRHACPSFSSQIELEKKLPPFMGINYFDWVASNFSVMLLKALVWRASLHIYIYI